jgi:D-serine dehydratase
MAKVMDLVRNRYEGWPLTTAIAASEDMIGYVNIDAWHVTIHIIMQTGISMNIEELQGTKLDSTIKGIPDLGERSIALEDIPTKGWNLLAGDLPIPAATINLERLRANSLWMRKFTERHGVKICPHGKTTMAPQLFKLQLEDGAWGITVASTQQMNVCRRFGIRRILMANQLVGEAEMRSVFRALNEDPEFDFYCLVDSAENVKELHRAARHFPLRRPLQLLLEGGVIGGRTGCRSVDEAMRLALLIGECGPQLLLCGIEGFEGMIDRSDWAQADRAVNDFIGYLSGLLEHSAGSGLFTDRKPILSIGGSIYFDLVATHPHVHTLRDRCEILLRSGCYLTHDSKMLADNFRRARERTPDVGIPDGGLQPALNVWGRIQSMPESGVAILNLGKRDISYDVDLPMAEKWFRPFVHTVPLLFTEQATTTQINDHHTFLKVSPDSGLRVGDVIGFGVSHPCTTFDKWKLLYVVNERYDVVEGILTFF